MERGITCTKTPCSRSSSGMVPGHSRRARQKRTTLRGGRESQRTTAMQAEQAEQAPLASCIRSKLQRWAGLGEAPEYYHLKNRCVAARWDFPDSFLFGA